MENNNLTFYSIAFAFFILYIIVWLFFLCLKKECSQDSTSINILLLLMAKASSSVMFPNEFHVGLFGPTSVGKGFTLARLTNAPITGRRIHVISLGQEIRDRMEKDSIFRDQHEETLSRGDLLPYEVVTPLVEERLEIGRQSGCNAFFWEGYGRDRRQAHKMFDIWGDCPRENHRLFVLKASRETCEKRLADAITTGRRNTRSDNDKFPERFTLHAHHEPHVIEAAKSRGVNFRIIDADKPLDKVATEVLLHTVNIRHYSDF